MVSDHEDMSLRFAEVIKEASAILEHAEEASHHFNNNDLQAASEVLAWSHYKVSAYNSCKRALLEKLEAKGIVPGQKGEK